MSGKRVAYTPEDCFKIDDSVVFSNSLDPLYILSERAIGLLALLQSDGSEGGDFSIDHQLVMHNLWALEILLRQSLAILDAASASESMDVVND